MSGANLLSAAAAALLLLSGPASEAASAPGDGSSISEDAPAASAARRPRRRPRYKRLAVPQGPKTTLRSPGWTLEVRAALERLIEGQGASSRGYDPDWPPVAVLVLDDLGFAGHAGELAFLRMVDRAEFRFSPAWWELVPLEVRDRARRALRRFNDRPENLWPNDEDFLAWRKAMFEARDLVRRQQGRRACLAWLSLLLTGYTEGEIEGYMRDLVEEGLREPFTDEPIRAHAGDAEPIGARRGLRRVPELAELTDRLLRAGIDVWMLSASNQWVAEALAQRYGVDPSRVVGTRPRILNKRLDVAVVDPVPVGPGKPEAVPLFIGRDPALGGAGPDDEELLEYGRGLRVLVDPGDERFAARAKARGWLLQPRLRHGAAE
ncbi:MAG: haloacid dehalogenase-like hydrolase [Elusimicrobia bacterium]|nr:haloacid dehalogenase-like hydrolase [Elusimicrobiota bacterium]